MSAFVLWIALGVGFWVLEFAAPALVAGSLGAAALLVAFTTDWLSLPLQWFTFFALSSGFILLSRRLLPESSTEREESARDPGVVTVTILPGATGRVAYQGTTWNARSAAADRELPPGTQVIVVAQKGNMLDVVPIELLKS